MVEMLISDKCERLYFYNAKNNNQVLTCDGICRGWGLMWSSKNAKIKKMKDMAPNLRD